VVVQWHGTQQRILKLMSVIMPNVIMLSIIMLNVIMLSVVMLSAWLANIGQRQKWLTATNSQTYYTMV
jgi:hypothetical protein